MNWQEGVAVAVALLGLGGGGVPRGAAAHLLDRIRGTAGQCAATTGMALRLEEDAAGGGGCVASGREARAWG
jgi:hypothetical protein